MYRTSGDREEVALGFFSDLVDAFKPRYDPEKDSVLGLVLQLCLICLGIFALVLSALMAFPLLLLGAVWGLSALWDRISDARNERSCDGADEADQPGSRESKNDTSDGGGRWES